MAITLTVNSIPYEYPEEGDQAPWGEQATGWAKEVTAVLNSIIGPADILETSAIINNNQTTPLDIPGLFFDPAIVRSFTLQLSVYRTYNGNEVSESIQIYGLWRGASKWLIQQEGIGNAGVSFDITDAGQFQYTSTNLATPHTGILKFRANGIIQS